MTRITVLAALVTTALGSAVSAEAAGGKSALLAFVSDTTSAQGSFVQQVSDKNGVVAGGESSGTFMFERPGKFVWSTLKPYPQTIVSDARTVYVWDPDLNQVTVRKLNETVSSSPAAVLFGHGDIEKTFELADMPDEGTLRWVSARPRQEDLTYKRFEIGFDAKGMLAGMRLFDHFGQTVSLRFSEVRTNEPIDAARFVFKIPQGADVLHDTH